MGERPDGGTGSAAAVYPAERPRDDGHHHLSARQRGRTAAPPSQWSGLRLHARRRDAVRVGRQPPRVIRAGEAFWEPGGDIIHYSDANNRDDIQSRFVVTMLCVSGQPMLTLVGDDELAARAHLRVPGA